MKKVFKLYKGLLGAHFSAILITLILSIPLISFVKNEAVSTLITVLVYAAFIYSAGWNAGFLDSRKVGESVPSVKSACAAALMSCIIPLILLALRVIAYHVNPTVWRPYGEGHEMIKTSSAFLLTCDILYRLYNFFAVSWLAGGKLGMYILPLIFPVVLYPIAYIVGLTRFSIMEKYLPFLIYKPKNKKNRTQE
mgnify:CR=1 FL=1